LSRCFIALNSEHERLDHGRNRHRHRPGRLFAVVLVECATRCAERFGQRLQGPGPSCRSEDCIMASLESPLGSFRQRHSGCSTQERSYHFSRWGESAAQRQGLRPFCEDDYERRQFSAGAMTAICAHRTAGVAVKRTRQRTTQVRSSRRPDRPGGFRPRRSLAGGRAPSTLC